MKSSFFMMALGILLCSACILQILYIQEKPFRMRVPKEEQDHATEIPPRESITFVLGEDREQNNPYYREATSFYSNHPEGRTDYLVSGCRSLLEVHDYLTRHPPCNGRPWGLINLVSHGNPWAGMSVRVSPRSGRSNSESISSGTVVFNRFPCNVVDRETEIFVHGCGLGQDHELLRSLARAFASDDGEPVIRASTLFEYYLREQGALYPERYLANAYFLSYPMRERPSSTNLMIAFREKYPAVGISWNDALVRSRPRYVADPYSYSMEVPVKIVLPVDGEHDVQDETLIKWVACQKPVVDAVNKTGIPMHDFSWSRRVVYVGNETGTREKAYLVSGYATLILVLQALTVDGDDGTSRPLVPDANDLSYYGVSI